MASKSGGVALIYNDEPDADIAVIHAIDPVAASSAAEVRDRIRENDISYALAFRLGSEPFPIQEILNAEKLRWIQLSSAGIDHLANTPIDDVVITNARGVHTDVLAQYVLCRVLEHYSQFNVFSQQQLRKEWQPQELISARGKRAIVVGYGSIGQRVAEYLRSVRISVTGVARKERATETGEKVVGIDALPMFLGEADVVVLTLPLTEHTRGFFGAKKFNAMKRGSYFVNISRGGIVDEGAMVKALSTNHLAAAAVDVFEQEPLPKTSPLWDVPNLRITPHSGEAMDWKRRVLEIFAENYRRMETGEPLMNRVSIADGY